MKQRLTIRSISLVLLLLLIYSKAVLSQNYCTPSYNGTTIPTPQYTHFSGVYFGDIEYSITGIPGNTYQDLTSDTVTVARRGTYPLRLVMGNGANPQTVAVWIDFNQNGIFESSELIYTAYDPDNVGDHILDTLIYIPAYAKTGPTRMRLGTKYGTGVPDPCQNNTGLDWSQNFHDYTLNIIDPDVQVYESSNTMHPTLKDITPGTQNNLMLRIDVEMNIDGVYSPFFTGDLEFSTLGTTNFKDIDTARLYFSGLSPFFSNAVEVGKYAAPNGNFSINATQPLGPGVNYFWLSYDISENALYTNKIDASCYGIEIGNHKRIPETISPEGNREVGYCVTSGIRNIYIYVANVTLDSIDNTTTDEPDGYGDFTSDTAWLEIGKTYPVSFIFGNSVNSAETRAWIDYNRDGYFNNNEELVFEHYWIASVAVPNTTPVTDSITIPSSAVSGPTRMRVSAMYSGIQGANLPEACDNPIMIGESEDYTIMLMKDGEPVSDFAATTACLGDTSFFIDKSYTFGSAAINYWHWDFGNGDSSLLQNPEYVYNSSGSYKVTLTVSTDSSNTLSSISKIVSVNDPIVDFGYTTNLYQTPVRFYDLTQNAIVKEWSWNFDDPSSGVNNTSEISSPVHVFNDTGYYNVKLLVNTEACLDSVTKNIHIVDKIAPVADFNASAFFPYYLQKINLVDISLYQPDEWKWSISPQYHTYHDGTTDTSQFPVVSLDTLLTFSIQLIASNSAGSDTISKTFNTLDYMPPTANFSADPLNIKAGQHVTFLNLSSNNPINYIWSFGDGDTSYEHSLYHQYVDTGTYTVSLYVSNPAGSDQITRNDLIEVSGDYLMCDGNAPVSTLYSGGRIYDSGGPNANYSNNSNCGFLIKPPCAGNIVLVFSAFNFATDDYVRVYDGVDNTGIPLHTGNGFTGTTTPSNVTATSGAMYIEEITNASVTAAGFEATWYAADNLVPVAEIGTRPIAYVNSPLGINNFSSIGVGNEYYWDLNGDDVFNDHDARTFFRHTYTDTATIYLKLIAKNCAGSDTAFHELTIKNVEQEPLAAFYAEPREVFYLEQNIQLRDTSLHGSVQRQWSFDPPNAFYAQGNQSAPDPVVAFLEPGYYTVTLTASNDSGVNVLTKTNYILVKDVDDLCLQPYFSNVIEGKLFDSGGKNAQYSPNQTCNYLISPECATSVTLEFIKYQIAMGDVIYVYDGTSDQGTPLHTQSGFTRTNPPLTSLTANSGSMFIRMTTNSTVDSGFEARWTSQLEDTIVAFFFAPDTIWIGDTVDFSNATSGNVSNYYWDFNSNGITDDTSTHPSKQFTQTGDQLVTLKSEGCINTDEYSQSIYVKNFPGKPKAGFYVNQTHINSGNTIEFTDTSENIPQRWYWSISPAGGYTYINGTSYRSQHPHVRFDADGEYEVKLVAENFLGKDSVIKTDHIIVFSYCIPEIISAKPEYEPYRVILQELDNMQQSSNAYSENIDSGFASLNRSSHYQLIVVFNSALNNVQQKAWIDFNRNGSFDDTLELVSSYLASGEQVWISEVFVPEGSYTGPSRLRIGIAPENETLESCAIISEGIFRDYRVMLEEPPAAERPVITLLGDNPLNAYACVPFSDPGYTAFDSLDGDLTSQVIFDGNLDSTLAGIYRIAYKVTNSAGVEAAVKNRIYIMIADHLPEITLSGPDSFYNEVYIPYIDPGYTGFDICDGDISNEMDIATNLDIGNFGVYTITYNLTNSNDNSAIERTRIVTVGDTTPPVITLLGGDTIYHPLGKSYSDPGYNVDDNYDPNPIVFTSGTVNPNVKDTFRITYNSTDVNGNQAISVLRVVIVNEFTSIQNIENNVLLNVFPNPVSDLLTVNIETYKVFKNISFTLTDLSGRIIYVKKVNENDKYIIDKNIDVSEIQSGAYILNVSLDMYNFHRILLIN